MYKVTQEGSIQGIEPIYNQTVVSEEFLETQIRAFLEPYFQIMDEVWDEERVVSKTIKNKYFFYEDIAFGSNIEIIIEPIKN